MNLLDFEQWYQLNCDNISCAAAESGADRELDYDPDWFEWEMYDAYVLKYERDNAND